MTESSTHDQLLRAGPRRQAGATDMWSWPPSEAMQATNTAPPRTRATKVIVLSISRRDANGLCCSDPAVFICVTIAQPVRAVRHTARRNDGACVSGGAWSEHPKRYWSIATAVRLRDMGPDISAGRPDAPRLAKCRCAPVLSTPSVSATGWCRRRSPRSMEQPTWMLADASLRYLRG
jgi:hypothetical protein